jgi:acyl-lipid omega-6 desaturase (Delta-12 desaturase)
VHHLSARIPNYNLRACHAAYRELFREVPRLTLKDVPRSMQYIIWDETQKTLITAAQFANTRLDETSQPAMAAE